MVRAGMGVSLPMSSGVIGVIADHASRYTWFHSSLAELDKPEGTKIEWRIGANRGESRNSLVRQCLDERRDWVFFVDDDECFPPDVLTKLLAHEQPVVSALILQRGMPYLPTCYATFNADGTFSPLDLKFVGGDTLVQCAGLGSGGLLVRSHVFKTVSEPWFVYTEDFGEDLFFSRKCAAFDIPMCVDTGCRIGHIIPAAVFAQTKLTSNSMWEVGIQLSNGTRAAVPMDHSPVRTTHS